MGLIKLFSLIVILFVLYFFIKMIYDYIVRKTREGFNVKKFFNRGGNKK